MNFETVVLEDIAAPIKNAIVGGPFGSNLVAKDYTTSGIPVIRGQNMGERWVAGDFAYVSEDKAEALSPNKARPGDLVFTQRGTLGQVAIVPNGKYPEYIVSQSQMKVTLDPAKADINYIYYVFRSDEQLDYIRNAAIQTGVPHTNLGILKKTPVRLPPIQVQREIAAILGAFDDRITLLRETNRTLEEMARLLFRAWFVDFEPVRAKMAGRTPESCDAATAGLFPSRLVDSQLGEIPEGWEAGSLSDLFSVIGGGTPKTSIKEYWNGNIPWYSVVDAPADSDIFVIDTDKKITQDGLKSSSTKILREGVTIISSRGTVGKLAIVGSEMAMNQSCYGLQGNKGDFFTFYAVRTAIDTLKQNAHGAIFDTITNATFRTVQAIIPPTSICGLFEQQTSPFMARIKTNVETIKSLTKTRDELLPRLMSCSLKLPESLTE
jgi:type I restriction enzyme S subunit